LAEVEVPSSMFKVPGSKKNMEPGTLNSVL
jgi:hypothetical protein